MSRRGNPDWRDQAAGGLVIRHLPRLDFTGPILVMEDVLEDVADSLRAAGHEVETWNRRALRHRPAQPWPPASGFKGALLRLPRGKAELSMSLHAAASVLEPRGRMVVVGAKDEGIQSASSTMESVFDEVESVATGARCRVLRGVRKAALPGLKGSLSDWKELVAMGHPQLPADWVSYPGVFSRGRLDDGTRFLLDALPALPSGARVLDYGCGSGVVGYVARQRGKDLVMELLDVDSVALEAASENVPGCPIHLHDGLLPPEAGVYDAILSNPPFHRGKGEDQNMIASLLRAAPGRLTRDGRLVFVSQRRIPVMEVLEEGFKEVSVLAEDSSFRVWMGRRPRKKAGRK